MNKKSIALIGLPGSGKTTLGELLAGKLGLSFVDLDSEIEKAEGSTIQEIFKDGGEAAFRNLESAMLDQLSGRQGIVLATGGGAVLRDENTHLLGAMGMVVFVDRPVEHIRGDIQTDHRPLLREGVQALDALAADRRPRYLDCADYVLDNSGDLSDTLAALHNACQVLLKGDYTVIGDPISHARSPQIHALAFAAQGLEAEYGAVHVPRGTLPAFVRGVAKSSLKGFNVTIPHKSDIIPLLDEVEGGAALCGAVNTVVRKNGRLCGYNTDMEGLNLSLIGAGSGFERRRVLVLGAGGAARAAALKAALAGAASLHIAARNTGQARELGEHVARAADIPVTSGGFGPELAEACRDRELLLNATPLGMTGFGRDFDDLNFVAALPAGAMVCDLVYTPPETALLKEAAGRGLATLNGMDMLVYQALLAQELFLGRQVDKAALFKTVKKETAQ